MVITWVVDESGRGWVLMGLVKDLGARVLNQHLVHCVVRRHGQLVAVYQQPLANQHEKTLRFHQLILTPVYCDVIMMITNTTITTLFS